MSDHDDSDLFKQAMTDVRPISHDRATLRKKPAAIKKRATDKKPLLVDRLSDDFIPECGEYLEFMRPGVQKSLLKQIRNGRFPAEDRIDLHGHTRDQARLRLLQFIQHAQLEAYKIVCVVHGKGFHSDDGRPVLKAMVNKWLQDIPEVLAFTTAQARDGGTGAVYVLVKRLLKDR
jgi:DNA-nicking Smr family endonuclease